MIRAGLPPEVSAVTINKVCGSGLKAVMLAAQAIRAGDAQLIVAGGQESMSNAPYYLYGARQGLKLGDKELVDGMIKDGLWCSFCDVHMGNHAEHTAIKAGITRQMQDEFAVASHKKAADAQQQGRFRDEIVPVEITGRKASVTVSADEGPRADTSVESLAKLRPAFGGAAPGELSVTAGNASSLNDGASALVVASEEYAEAHDLDIFARIGSYATGAVDPQELFFAPIKAVRNLMAKENRKIGDYDLIEANEAFASQALADGNELGWDWDRVNVNGGAIALGHPIGASGARVLTTLLYAMKNRGARENQHLLNPGTGRERNEQQSRKVDCPNRDDNEYRDSPDNAHLARIVEKKSIEGHEKTPRLLAERGARHLVNVLAPPRARPHRRRQGTASPGRSLRRGSSLHRAAS
jgi:acetyl-CoA C-acetyltransferase